MGLSFETGLAPSRRARRMRAIALALTGVAAAACLLAFLLAPSGARLAAVLASIALPGAAALRKPATPASRLAVTADGSIRIEAGGEIQSAAVGYCGGELICLKAAGKRYAVWPDALTGSDWRRLLVACRWPHAPDGASCSAGRTN
jgi:hypothetical protein